MDMEETGFAGPTLHGLAAVRWQYKSWLHLEFKDMESFRTASRLLSIDLHDNDDSCHIMLEMHDDMIVAGPKDDRAYFGEVLTTVDTHQCGALMLPEDQRRKIAEKLIGDLNRYSYRVAQAAVAIMDNLEESDAAMIGPKTTKEIIYEVCDSGFVGIWTACVMVGMVGEQRLGDSWHEGQREFIEDVDRVIPFMRQVAEEAGIQPDTEALANKVWDLYLEDEKNKSEG